MENDTRETCVVIARGGPHSGKQGLDYFEGVANLFAVLVFVIWLYGTLVLAERRAGYIIILLGSLLGLVVPVIHMKGASGVVGGEIGKSTQAFFFVWTLLALGVTAMFSAILSAHALWRLPWRRQRVLPPEKHSTAKGC